MPSVGAQRNPDPIPKPVIMRKGILSLQIRQFLPGLRPPVHPLIGRGHTLFQSERVQPPGRLSHIHPAADSIDFSGQKPAPETQSRRQVDIVEGPRQRGQFKDHPHDAPRGCKHDTAVNAPGQVHSVSALSDLFRQVFSDIHMPSPLSPTALGPSAPDGVDPPGGDPEKQKRDPYEQQGCDN